MFGCILILSLSCSGRALGSTAVEPLPREEALTSETIPGSWRQRHEEFIALGRRQRIDVLFLGDSITDYWRTTGHESWSQQFKPLHAANFAIAGDRTQHLLWRLRHGEIATLHPRVIVLLIGSNNTGTEKDGMPRNAPREVVDGIAAVVNLLRAQLPDSQILLLALLPRGEREVAQRAEITAINAALPSLQDGVKIHLLDLGFLFLRPDGSLRRELLPDSVHPSAAGYRLLADLLAPQVRRLLLTAEG